MTQLIAASLGLIVVSSIALVFGWGMVSSALIWLSVLSSAGAAICLALAYYRSRTEIYGAPPRAAARTRTRAQTAVASRRVPRRRGAPMPGDVLANPGTKRYHRTECRFAKTKDSYATSQEVARRRGYSPCGVCKP